MRAHLEECDLCREVVSLLGPDARAETLPAGPPAPRPPRERIGRYRTEGVLGTGGMGMVLLAHDPELGRPVAIKLLRGEAHPAREGHRARLVREAKAMAALSHPNVVTIYDVGEDGGEIYLAMELVRGRTLRTWLLEQARGWKDILPIFVQAGRGLAAAHAIDIIHRDFKPENVFVGDDGRVRVGDFGLARGAGATARVPDDAVDSGNETRPGAVLGTLRYMAPEQIEGLRADARTDQFSFCVALYEALYGARPWTETSVEGMRAAFREGREAVVPRRSKIPAWLGRIVARGLRIDPAARFASMTALLRALTDDLAARKRRGILGAAAAGLVACVAVAFVVGQSARGKPRPCQGGPELLERVYGRETRASLAAFFAASPQPYVRTFGDRVTARLDALGDEWLAAHRDACEATVVRGEQSPELMDLRMGCLKERLGDVGALVGELRAAPPQDLVHALEAVQSLEPVSTCADGARLRARMVPPPPDPKTAAAAEAVRARVLEARIITDLGAYSRALGIAQAALADAERAGFPPVEGEARFQLAKVYIGLGRGPEATAELHKAAAIADASRHDQLAAEARVELVYSIGYREGKLDESDTMIPYAAAAIQRLGGSPRLAARLLFHRSAALALAQRPAEALPLAEEALVILERAHDPDENMRASLYNRIGTDLKETARYAESLEAYDKALAIRDRLFGPDHPGVAVILSNRGGTLRYLARYDEALADLQRALAIRRAALGPDHQEVAVSLTNLANTHAVLGRLEEAHREREQALAIVSKAVSPDHPFAVTMRSNYVDSLMALGRSAEALAFCDKWLPTEREKRPTTRITGNLTLTCALAHLRAGQTQAAWELYRAGDAIVSRPQPDEPGIEGLTSFAKELVARGDAREALPIIERTLEVRRQVLGPDHPKTAESASLLAEAQRHLRR